MLTNWVTTLSAKAKATTDMETPLHGSKHWLEYATAIFALFAAIGGIAAAGFAGWQALLTRQSLEIANRAFVSVDVVEGSVPVYFVNDPLPGRLFRFLLANKGNTPTKDLVVNYSCYPSEKELEEPWSAFSEAKKRSSHIPIFIGAHSTGPIACSFTNDQLVRMQDRRLFGYIMVDVKYFDRIARKVARRTELSLRLFNTKVENSSSYAFHASLENVGKHNCADEECPKDDPSTCDWNAMAGIARTCRAQALK